MGSSFGMSEGSSSALVPTLASCSRSGVPEMAGQCRLLVGAAANSCMAGEITGVGAVVDCQDRLLESVARPMRAGCMAAAT